METEATQTAAPAPAAPAEAAPAAPSPAQTAPAAVEAPNSQTAAPETTLDFIKQGLSEIYAPASETAPEAAPEAAPEVVAPDEQPDAPNDDPAAPASEAAPEAAPETDDDPLIKALASKPAIKSADEINAEFNRAPKGIRDLAISYGEEAARSRQVIESLGGSHFIEPLQQIAESLKTGDNKHLFEGVLSAASVDGFAGLLEDSLSLAFEYIPNREPATEGEKVVRDQTLAVIDRVLQSRFGEQMSLQQLDEIAKYLKDGYLNLDDVRGYYKTDGETENPVIQAKDAEIERLKAQLDEKSVSESEAKKQQQETATEQFKTFATSSLTKVLEKQVFANSVINPKDSDTPEVKTGKTAVKSLLSSFIEQQMTANPAYGELQKAFLRGEQGTARYQSASVALLETAMLEAQEMAAQLESVFAGAVTSSRNNTLLNDPPANEPGEPTIPPKADPKTMSDEEYRAWLGQQIASVSTR